MVTSIVLGKSPSIAIRKTHTHVIINPVQACETKFFNCRQRKKRRRGLEFGWFTRVYQGGLHGSTMQTLHGGPQGWSTWVYMVVYSQTISKEQMKKLLKKKGSPHRNKAILVVYLVTREASDQLVIQADLAEGRVKLGGLCLLSSAHWHGGEYNHQLLYKHETHLRFSPTLSNPSSSIEVTHTSCHNAKTATIYVFNDGIVERPSMFYDLQITESEISDDQTTRDTERDFLLCFVPARQ